MTAKWSGVQWRPVRPRPTVDMVGAPPSPRPRPPSRKVPAHDDLALVRPPRRAPRPAYMAALLVAALLSATTARCAGHAGRRVSRHGSHSGSGRRWQRTSAPWTVRSRSSPDLAYGGMVPVTQTFDGSGSFCLEVCSIISWDWTFGDGTGASGPVVSHTYTTSGLYPVTLTVHSSNGLTGTASVYVNAATATLGSFTMTPSSGLLPLAVAFDASASVTNWDRTIVSYAWDFGDGATGSGRLVNHVYTTAGIRQGVPEGDRQRRRLPDRGGPMSGPGPGAPAEQPQGDLADQGRGEADLDQPDGSGVGAAHERCTGSSCTSFVPIFVTQGTTTSSPSRG